MARRGRRQIAADLTQLPVIGMAEAAALLGVDPRTLAKQHSRGQLPAPLAQLACGPIWETRVILEYAQRRSGGHEVAAGVMAAEPARRLLVDDTGAPFKPWKGGASLEVVAEHTVVGASEPLSCEEDARRWQSQARPDESQDEELMAIDQILVGAGKVVKRAKETLAPIKKAKQAVKKALEQAKRQGLLPPEGSPGASAPGRAE